MRGPWTIKTERFVKPSDLRIDELPTPSFWRELPATPADIEPQGSSHPRVWASSSGVSRFASIFPVAETCDNLRQFEMLRASGSLKRARCLMLHPMKLAI